MKLPVLMYHQIDGGDRYRTTRERLREQLLFLSRASFRTIVPDELTSVPPADRPVMLSFDDGYASDHEIALPLFGEFGFRGVSFVTTGFIGRPGYLAWRQIRELQQAGFSIQSHSHTHALLATLPRLRLREELVRSRSLLEDRLGVPVNSIALPGGGTSPRVVTAAFEAGYRYLFTSVPGLNNLPVVPGSVLSRSLIHEGTDFARFADLVTGNRRAHLQSRIYYHLRGAVKDMLGPLVYHRLWTRYCKFRSLPPQDR